MIKNKICKGCGKRFDRIGKYCSKECQDQRNRDNSGRDYELRNNTTSSIGTISELAVCNFFLFRNFDVFRSISPHSKVDVMAIHRVTEEIFSVEVKTGNRKVSSGNICYAKPRNKQWSLLAVYIPEENSVILYDTNYNIKTLD